MAQLRTLQSDLSRESSGIWCRYPGSDVEFLIARMGNPSFEQAATKLRGTAKARRVFDLVRNGDMESDDALEVLAPLVAEHIVRDVKNLELEPGQPFAYNAPAFTQVLRARESRDLLQWILRQSQNADLYRQTTLEEDAGNSQSS